MAQSANKPLPPALVHKLAGSYGSESVLIRLANTMIHPKRAKTPNDLLARRLTFCRHKARPAPRWLSLARCDAFHFISPLVFIWLARSACARQRASAMRPLALYRPCPSSPLRRLLLLLRRHHYSLGPLEYLHYEGQTLCLPAGLPVSIISPLKRDDK